MTFSTNTNHTSSFNFKSIATGLIIGSLITYFVLNINTPNAANCDITSFEQSKIIPISKAKEMYDAYTNRRASIIESFENISSDGVSDFKASRYGSYSFEHLKSYMAYLECIDDKIKSSTQGSRSIESIRFYFAAYPNADTFSDGSEMVTTSVGNTEHSLRRRSTFMMLPTTQFDDGENGFVFNLSGDNIQLTKIKNASGNHTSLVMNEVGLVPPPSSAVENDFN